MTADPVGPYPQAEAREAANLVAQAGIGSIPLVGGALAPIVAKAIAEPLERRRTAWFTRLGEGLQELASRFEGFDPTALGQNEDFVSAIVESTDAAMKASSEAKRERLANVVLNIAAGRSINEVLRGRFMSLVSTFSEEHILLLRLCDDPPSFPRVVQAGKNMMAGAKLSAFEPELRFHGVSSAVIDLVSSELKREGLIEGNLSAMVSGPSILAKSTTPSGQAFLGFIKKPTN